MMITQSLLPLPVAMHPWPLGFLAFAVGACIGSFLNVCIYRLPEDESVVFPGSRCPHCQHEIAWYDNLPIVSWLLLRARCRQCAAPIAARYPLVELLTGAFAVAVLVRFGPTVEGLVAFALSAALLLITFIDLDHFIIPDEVSLPGIAIGLLVSLLPGGIGLTDAFFGAVLGGGILWAVAWSYERTTGTEGMGFGDVKLLAMIGAFLGWQAIPMVLVIASVVGSLAGLLAIFTPAGFARIRRVRRVLGPGAVAPHLRRAARTTAIPFGPFLALGALVLLYVPGLSLPFELVTVG
jgi:leader peptidase (prepilin peptidase)/N-methyltransferase